MLLLVKIASAIDADADGWCDSECLPGEAVDCDPADPGVNPGSSEDGVDRVDHDCDGSPSIRRDYVTGFEFLNDFALTGSVTVLAGHARLVPGSSGASLTWKGPVPWESGHAWLTADTTQVSAACTLTLSSSSASASASLGPGLTTVDLAVDPGDTVQAVLACTGAGEARVDWLTLQNGDYAWAPLVDVSWSFSDLGVPTGGRQSVVRLTEAYSTGGAAEGGLVLLGSDVGGVGWMPFHDPGGAGSEVFVANGGWNEWSSGEDLGVADLYGEWRGDEESGGGDGLRDPSEHDVYALTGRIGWDFGGLWWTDDLAGSPQSWTEAPGGLLAFKQSDDCDPARKSLGSGRLLVEWPGSEDWLVVAAGGPSAAGSPRGVWLWEKRSANPPSSPFTGLPEDATVEGLPSALATADLGAEAVLLVGYRALVPLGGALADATALYACPAADPYPGALGFAPDCVPVIDSTGDSAWDVRDVEVVAASPAAGWALFLVADGGRSWSTTCTSCVGACEAGEATVYAVLVEWDGTDWGFEVWDTDTADPTPDWLGGTSGASYYTVDDAACIASAGAPSLGNLDAPTVSVDAEGYDLSAIAVDPGGDWAFAFYPKPNNQRRWGCAGSFRASLADLAVDAPLAWEPLQDYAHGEMSWAGTHAGERRAHVDTRGSYLEDEPLPEMFAGTYVHDAAFVPAKDTGAVWLLTGGAFHWWLAPVAESTSAVGWDSPAGADLDLVDHALAWAGHESGPVFQDLVVNTVAVCPACRLEETVSGPLRRDVVLGGGASDYKYHTLYPEYGWTQPPGERPCEFHMVAASPPDIEVWHDPEGAYPSQAWMILANQDASDADAPYLDPMYTRALFFSTEASAGGPAWAGDLGAEWCWDGWDADGAGRNPGFAGANYVDALDWTLNCQDSNDIEVDQHGFSPCYENVEAASDFVAPAMGPAGVGVPVGIEALGPDTALLATIAACGDPLNPCSADDADLRGLWMVRYVPEDGLFYTPVEMPADLDGCAPEDLLQYRFESGALLNGRPSLAVHPASGWAEGETVRAFLSSRDATCGVVEVSFTVPALTGTRGDPLEPPIADATWTRLNLDDHVGVECDLGADPWYLNGVHVSRDGRWLFLRGGWTIDPAAGPPTALCAVDLATGSAGAYTGWREVVPGPWLQMPVMAMASHPHLEDTWYIGGSTNPDCPLCTPPGLFTVQRRRRWAGGAWQWAWSSYRSSDDDLPVRQITDIALGPGVYPTGTPSDDARRVYVATSGGSWWEGEVSW